ncbi:hypothetical protein [Pseudidiomarina sediminum]|uniref:hypothetical protein n=1 Tax=Pseudidiomarina sediminum TaxID=431675 RepID=UPI001C938F1F|nr:hypothetical protein [Pseudidiomarina sediminum]MBY6062923.1 hypothetical protein [Pseudidiomarina sediminum]
MKDARLRCPVEKEYVEALGLAAYTFASLEWQVVWCMEMIKPESIHKVVGEEMTAGTIAKKFIDVTRNMPKSKERETLKALAQKFMELVQVRNKIMHGKPCTCSGQQNPDTFLVNFSAFAGGSPSLN